MQLVNQTNLKGLEKVNILSLEFIKSTELFYQDIATVETSSDGSQDAHQNHNETVVAA